MMCYLETGINDHTIEVVTAAFVVVIGVAVERSLADFPLGKYEPVFRDPATGKPKRNLWFWLGCYALSQMIIVTLVLRFLMGSDTHLRRTFVETKGIQDLQRFIGDVCALMFFGAFLVGAALSRSVRRFMMWLALVSAVGIFWSLRESCWYQEGYFGNWWLRISVLQFVVTLPLFLLCRKFGQHPKAGIWVVRCSLIAAFLLYAVIFPLDLKHIISQ